VEMIFVSRIFFGLTQLFELLPLFVRICISAPRPIFAPRPIPNFAHARPNYRGKKNFPFFFSCVWGHTGHQDNKTTNVVLVEA